MSLNSFITALNAVGEVLSDLNERNREVVIVREQPQIVVRTTVLQSTRKQKESELRRLILTKGGLSKFNTSYSRMTGDCFRCLWTLEDIQSLSDSKLDLALDVARVM